MARSLWAKIVDTLKGDSPDERPQPRGVDDFLGVIGSDAPEYSGKGDGGAAPPIAPRTGAEFALMEAPPTEFPEFESESVSQTKHVSTKSTDDPKFLKK